MIIRPSKKMRDEMLGVPERKQVLKLKNPTVTAYAYSTPYTISFDPYYDGIRSEWTIRWVTSTNSETTTAR